MGRSQIVGLLLFTLTIFTTNTLAALITSIDNLDIGGVQYKVTFHSESFNEVFDADEDGIFGDSDGSIINHTPLFLGDEAGANAAALAIMGALGDSDHVSTIGGVSTMVYLFLTLSYHAAHQYMTSPAARTFHLSH